MNKPKKIQEEAKERMENIEIALMDIALAIESGEWQGIYQKVGNQILPDQLKEPEPKQIPLQDIIKLVESMYKPVCGCEEDEDPMALGYHTKECDMQPYGWNSALDTLLTKLKEI